LHLIYADPMFKKNCHRFLSCLFLLLLVSCEPPPSLQPATTDRSSPICVLNTAESRRLQEFTQILADSETGYTIEDIAQPGQQNRFVAFPDKDFELQSHRLYWGKIQLENRLPEAAMRNEWVLNFSSTFTSLTLFRPTENGSWATEVNGSFVPAHQKSFVPTQDGNLFKLVLPPGKVVTLYFRGTSERSTLPPTFHAYLQPLDVFYDKLVAAKSSDGLFAGFLLMMLLYNLLKFFFVRDRSYLYYAGYLLMVAVYTSYSSEDLMDRLGDFAFADHPAYYSLFKASIFLGLMCYLAFIRSFLDLAHLLPKWDRFFRYSIWLGVPLMALFFFLAFRYNFSYDINDRPILAYIALVSISGFIFIYPLFKTKDPKGFFITAGIAVISLGFLLTLHSRMTETPFTVFYLKVAAIVEFLIFSMGLAYRERQREVDRQQADFALRESRLLQEKKQVEADRLQDLNDFKSRFFTNITHEFRTPLTVILGMAEQLKKEGGRLTEDAKNGINLIKRSGENLLQLVNQVLDLAKLESNTLKMNYIQGDILTFIRYIAESLHSLSNAHNLLLRVESDQAKIVMDYDPERFLQIIHNLLSNAIKFTPSGGRVILRAELKGKWLQISVTDSGAGIAPDDLPQLFERFFQAKNQEHAKAGGTGIGLSLTRELVKAMGGDISVESQVGVGSTFFVKLPVTNNGVLEVKGSEASKDTATSGPTVPTKASAKVGAPSSITNEPDRYEILLIEDNPDVVEYLNACLKDHYHLDFAYNGQAGIEKALETIPDLIISDVMMPIKDGFEVVETLKNDERTSHIPIILLTAKADVESRLTGLRQGADAYLSKPFHQEELLVTLENLLESRRKLQLKYQHQLLSAETSSLPAAATEMEDVFLQNVRTIIEARYSEEDFGLPQLCQKIGMSRSQLFRKMKALTDTAPSDLIRLHRLNKAKTLLESGAANVSEAAWEVGFKDPSYFSKLYQEEFGEAPSATRK
jgi:signal transduction histidine kinase/DNA-binding response OmpR family regulator